MAAAAGSAAVLMVLPGPATLPRPRPLLTTVPVVAVDTSLMLLGTRCFLAAVAVPLLPPVRAGREGGGGGGSSVGAMARFRLFPFSTPAIVLAAALAVLPLVAREDLVCSMARPVKSFVAIVVPDGATVAFKGDAGRVTVDLAAAAMGRTGE